MTDKKVNLVEAIEKHWTENGVIKRDSSIEDSKPYVLWEDVKEQLEDLDKTCHYLADFANEVCSMFQQEQSDCKFYKVITAVLIVITFLAGLVLNGVI